VLRKSVPPNAKLASGPPERHNLIVIVWLVKQICGTLMGMGTAWLPPPMMVAGDKLLVPDQLPPPETLRVAVTLVAEVPSVQTSAIQAPAL